MKTYAITKTNEREKAAWWLEDEEGNCYYSDMLYPYGDVRVNLAAMTFTFGGDKDCPTLQEMTASGRLEVRNCYGEKCVLRYCDKTPENTDDIDVEEVREYFLEKGYEISEEAIMHNFEAWKNDYKSAYRDEEHGTHLFSPCGHNPLTFVLTKLHPLAADWQTTYIA